MRVIVAFLKIIKTKHLQLLTFIGQDNKEMTSAQPQAIYCKKTKKSFVSETTVIGSTRHNAYIYSYS